MVIIDFYPIQKRWRKLGPIYRSPEAKAIWLPEMMDYQRQRMEDLGVQYAYPEDNPDLRPADWESCDWRLDRGKPGPEPAFWQYLTHGSCHWMANLSLFVAQIAEPKRTWRIITSELHSTVWDGAETLWDPQFQALGVTATDAWDRAADGPGSLHRPVGEFQLHSLENSYV